MHRRTICRTLVAAPLGLAAFAAGLTADAQEGTPEAGPPRFEIAPGVTAEALAFAPGQPAPSLYRLTFAPGVVYAVAPAPDISLAYGETGSLTITVDAAVTVARAGERGMPGEAVAAGVAFALEAGDYTVLPPFATGEVRNEGEEAASILVAAIVPAASGAPSAATPTS